MKSQKRKKKSKKSSKRKSSTKPSTSGSSGAVPSVALPAAASAPSSGKRRRGGRGSLLSRQRPRAVNARGPLVRSLLPEGTAPAIHPSGELLAPLQTVVSPVDFLSTGGRALAAVQRGMDHHFAVQLATGDGRAGLQDRVYSHPATALASQANTFACRQSTSITPRERGSVGQPPWTSRMPTFTFRLLPKTRNGYVSKYKTRRTCSHVCPSASPLRPGCLPG